MISADMVGRIDSHEPVGPRLIRSSLEGPADIFIKSVPKLEFESA